MELNESRNIVKTLAQGVHPSTGEVFPPESPYNDPEVIRALFSILEVGKSRQATEKEHRGETPREPRDSAGRKRRSAVDRGRPRAGQSHVSWKG